MSTNAARWAVTACAERDRPVLLMPMSIAWPTLVTVKRIGATSLAVFAFGIAFGVPLDLAERLGIEVRGWTSFAVMVPAFVVGALAASCAFTWALEGPRSVAAMVRVRRPGR